VLTVLKFHERVKDALDPRGVIAPGKSGIWPERFRGQSH
jgi:4-cresol dehydrogenase (hydroxylating)